MINQIDIQQVVPNVFANKKEILSDVWKHNISFRKESLYLIESDSGAGKSSLCSFLYGLRDDYNGRLLFDKRDIRSFSAGKWSELRKESLSILFQDLRIFAQLTAYENVEIKNQLTHFKTRHDILLLFQRLGIEAYADTPLSKMSYGQQQRVAFVRALCQPFDFIFLDEPISHLDDMNSSVMSDILLEELKNREASAIVTSIGKQLSLPYDIQLRL